MLHTANPITGAKGEVFGELVQGMGEALVGNHPGRALSFKANGSQAVKVYSFSYPLPFTSSHRARDMPWYQRPLMIPAEVLCGCQFALQV